MNKLAEIALALLLLIICYRLEKLSKEMEEDEGEEK